MSSLALNLANDYLVWDGTESVSYEVTRGAQPDPLAANQGLAPPVVDTVPVALRRAVRQSQKLRNPVYAAFALTWHLPAAVVPQSVGTPHLGDVVVDQTGARWTVQEVDFNTLQSVWKLLTLNLTLALNLRDKVDVQRPGVTQGPGGENVRAWPPDPKASVPYAALPARLQLSQAATAEERGARDLERRYDVIVGKQVAVTLQDRLSWLPAGATTPRYLDITGYREAQRVDELPAIEAVLRVGQ